MKKKEMKKRSVMNQLLVAREEANRDAKRVTMSQDVSKTKIVHISNQ